MNEFKIGWEPTAAVKLHEYWDDILTNQVWTSGKYTRLFEEVWGGVHERHAVAFSSWTGAALAALTYYGIVGKTVVCPGNTMVATLKAPLLLGNQVILADVGRDDLCMNLGTLMERVDKRVAVTGRMPEAVFLVHIGGHLAFDSQAIREYCRARRIVLIEDCAHAHGATFMGARGGAFGDAGIYSFYATKTISTGEGGMLVTRDENLVKWARLFRNYGKDEKGVQTVQNRYAMNYRMNEFTAALGLVQTHNLERIVGWKNEKAERLNAEYKKRVVLPRGMRSGYYKYIVFEKIEGSTGLVYGRPVYEEFPPNVPGTLEWRCEKPDVDEVAWLRNTRWVCANHWCVPIFYEGDGTFGRWSL